MKQLKGISLCIAVAFFTVSASAIDYPNKQITMIIPNTPGGASDACARIFASEAEKLLGQSILIVNKPGGNNAIGLEDMRMRKPDGYTIGYAPVESIMLKFLGQSQVVPEDFIYFARAMTIPACIAVHAKSDFKTLQDLIDCKSSLTCDSHARNAA